METPGAPADSRLQELRVVTAADPTHTQLVRRMTAGWPANQSGLVGAGDLDLLPYFPHRLALTEQAGLILHGIAS
jgi:hypothetical protein